jgi:hypothetical protein
MMTTNNNPLAQLQLTSSQQDSKLIQECNSRMESIMRLCNTEPSVLGGVDQMFLRHETTFADQFERKLSQGKTLQRKLEKQIDDESLKLRSESDAVAVLRERLQELTRQADWTKEQIEATNADTQKLAAEATRWKTIADAEQENMENTRIQGGRKAQRLQQQISLYASTTGIKWHYLEEEALKKNGEGSFLIGEVVRRVHFALSTVQRRKGCRISPTASRRCNLGRAFRKYHSSVPN